MTKELLKASLLWGFALWLIGYVLGILLFPVVPSIYIGWLIMPIGILLTLWVLLRRVRLSSFRQYILLALIWVIIAITCDYFLLVKLFKPEDGYYKTDVYLYYFLTCSLPLLVGWKKTIGKG